MKIKWKKTLICSFALLGVSLFATPNFLRTLAEETKPKETLFMPTSYEQYLPLESPTDIAVTANHIAVADGKSVYVYSQATGKYTAYTHNEHVNELHFSGNKLYFIDQSTKMYEINANALPSSYLSVDDAIPTGSSVVLSSDILYFSTYQNGQATIYSAPLSNPKNAQACTMRFSTETNPALAVSDGELYYTHENITSHLYRLGSEATSEISLPSKAIGSIAIDDGILYYTASGSFYAYALSNLAQDVTAPPLFKESANYTAISASEDGYIYAVCGSTIKRYSSENKCFTDYEISASSKAENRLSGATDSTLIDNLLITLDSGNARVSVSNLTDKTNRTFPSIVGDKISSDGKTALVANDTGAALYDIRTGESLATFPVFDSELVGITNVYGSYYFATKTGFGKLTDEYKISPIVPVTGGTPALLASDIFGTLYVGFASGAVYTYTESEFLSTETKREEADKIATLPLHTEKMLVDFDRNLYALKERALHVYQKGEWKTHSLTKTVVYGQNEQTPVSSVCFGIAENKAYILYAGNFLVQTDELQLPTLSKIAVNGADEEVFDDTSKFTLVEIAENTLYIHFDIERLNEAEVFPYLRHERKTDERTALKLGETERFNLVAVFEENSRTYTTALVEKSSCTKEIPETEFLKPAQEFSKNQTGYITNELPLYKYPYLSDILTVSTLPKNTQVKVLGEIEELDYRYYRIEYIDETGEIKTGYVPKSYVSPIDANYPETETVTAGDKQTDVDSLWRAAFILLGLSAIAVLADFLILRKKK